MATPATTITSFLLLLLSFSRHTFATPTTEAPSPYLSSTTLFSNYQKMLTNFKIFTYPAKTPFNFTDPPLSLFYTSLLSSPFTTTDPDEAHLFFFPFPSHLSTRSLARLIADLRTAYPYWDRALGADHFYLSRHGIGPSSDRNVVELKKNAVQISCLPSAAGAFVPHKDITLPPLTHAPLLRLPSAPNQLRTVEYVGYYRNNGSSLGWEMIKNLITGQEFLIESGPSDELNQDKLESSKFCLFTYDETLSRLSEALLYGCVPVVITDRPVQDLPFMDLLRWQDIALFVGSSMGVEELKRVLENVSRERHERMGRLGMRGAQHFVWNASPESFDAFHMLMYQLWIRRYAVRYTRWTTDKV